MFPEGNVPGYVCNHGSQRERDAASQGHTSSIPTRALLRSWKLTPAARHVLLSILVMTSPAPDVWPSILTDYTYDSELDIADGVPRSVSTQRLVPSGNQGYIRNLGRFQSCALLVVIFKGVEFSRDAKTSPQYPTSTKVVLILILCGI